MKFFTRLAYFFRKYPLLRVITASVLIIAGIVISAITAVSDRAVPYIESMEPPVSAPEEVIIIHGSNFGSTQQDSYVEISGSRLTQSSYLVWTETAVHVLVPQNVQDGLIYVVTAAGRSQPHIFANSETVPVSIRTDPAVETPEIIQIKDRNASIGGLLTITGRNFNSLRGASRVLFPSKVISGTGETEEYIAAAENDYEYWSDQEIRVRIPDGVSSGMMYIASPKNESKKVRFSLSSMPGTKIYKDKRIYLLSSSVDISDIVSLGEAKITLRIPKPSESAAQRDVQVTISEPEPIIPDYNGTIVHQIIPDKEPETKYSVNHSFVVPVYAVQTSISSKLVKPYSEYTKKALEDQLKQDAIVPSSDEKIQTTVRSIIKYEKNPYLQAKLIFDYMRKNYTLLDELRPAESSPLDLLEEKKGDTYDFAVLYAALARSAGIPCMPVGGILIDANMHSENHWWNEVYIENFGWIPVDVSLATGKKYEAFNNNTFTKDDYFGSLDAQHAAFSRGWNNAKSAAGSGKTVFRQRSYALLSVWEEAAPSVQKYSSIWSSIRVAGVY